MALVCAQNLLQSKCSCLHLARDFSKPGGSQAALFGVPFWTAQRTVRRTLSVEARGGKRRGGGVGFGPPPKVKKPKRKQDDDDPFRVTPSESPKNEFEEDGYASEGDDSVPEVVTNRMLKRMGLTVGIPLFLGLNFFPLFWYLKVMRHLEIPNWIPYFVSIFTFGAAAAGISYAILSVSWNPSQEGSALGWKEAQANWPVFWELLRNGGSSSNRRK